VTIAQAGQAIRSHQVSSVELTQRCLDQIAKLNPVLNAFITVTGDSALSRAGELDREFAQGIDRGPLHGIPIAHKDLMWTKGIRTTSGSKIFADFVPERDAKVVKKLAEAGTVLVGKAGLHELAYGITSDNPHFGTIRNPRNPEHSPGGSSGGSGVAVATGMALIATGTDTGGSIRVPASFCGVAGLKPTYGLIDRSGVQPLGLSLDHVGPMARTVGDLRFALDAMSQPARRKAAPAAFREIRIGLPENFYFETVMPEVKTAVHDAANRAENLGARLIPVRVPDIEALNTTGLVILLSEAAGVHHTHLHHPRLQRRGDFGSDVLALLDQGSLIPAMDYVNAQRQRKLILNEFHALFRSIDCLFTPATPITAPRIGQTEISLDGASYDTRILTTRFARGINVLGFPALAIPCGVSSDGLPIGLQMIARPFEDNLLLMLGEALER
jgi:aspartyl-tRNA(Asn)/glutamyl-tRNA(Gln) amidotransferase subunit A